MAKKYHKKSSSATKRGVENSSGVFPVFISGFILGIIACHLIPYLLKNDTQILNLENNNPVTKQVLSTPDFQFPDLLKGNQINLTSKEESANLNNHLNYILQVGSFKNKEDAESLRVKLLLLNLPVSTKIIKTSSDGNLHRVLVGPFTNTESVSLARKKLLEYNLDPLLLKRNTD